MRVVFLTPWWPYTEKPNFGIFVQEHAEALALAGAEVQVVSLVLVKSKKLFATSITSQTLASGIIVHTMKVESRFQEILYNFPPITIKWMLALCKKVSFNPDVLVGNVAYPGAIWTQAASRYFKAPYYVIEHWTKSPTYLQKGTYGSWSLAALNQAKAVFPVSVTLCQELVSTRVTSPTKVLGNVIDTDTFPFKEKPSNSPIQFLSIMELGPNKAPEIAIKALAKLQKEGLEFQYSIVGDGVRKAELVQLALQLGLPVKFLPRMPKAELAAILHQTRFLLHPSHIETFGVVIAEAMATGTPVIVSDLPVLHELVHEGYGYVVPNDENAWAGAIKKAINYPFANKAMSQYVAAHFSKKAIGTRLLGLLEKN